MSGFGERVHQQVDGALRQVARVAVLGQAPLYQIWVAIEVNPGDAFDIGRGEADRPAGLHRGKGMTKQWAAQRIGHMLDYVVAVDMAGTCRWVGATASWRRGRPGRSSRCQWR